MVIDAIKFPNAAACSGVAPAIIAQVIPAEVLSPAPQTSMGPGTGYAGTSVGPGVCGKCNQIPVDPDV